MGIGVNLRGKRLLGLRGEEGWGWRQCVRAVWAHKEQQDGVAFVMEKIVGGLLLIVRHSFQVCNTFPFSFSKCTLSESPLCRISYLCICIVTDYNGEVNNKTIRHGQQEAQGLNHPISYFFPSFFNLLAVFFNFHQAIHYIILISHLVSFSV